MPDPSQCSLYLIAQRRHAPDYMTVKVGTSIDVETRKKLLQTASPYELWTIKEIILTPASLATKMESLIIKAWQKKGFRMRGEWFALPNDYFRTFREALDEKFIESSWLAVQKVNDGKCDFRFLVEHLKRKMSFTANFLSELIDQTNNCGVEK